MTIAICMPIARAPHPRTVESLMALVDRERFRFYDLVGYPVDLAREKITAKALSDPDVSHLMWIDDDMVFAPDAVERLLELNLAVVGGMCFGRRPPYPPTMYRRSADTLNYEPIYDYEACILRVDATGAAFLLTHRTVYEAIDRTRPGTPFWLSRGRSEDIAFCERVNEAGLGVYVNTDLGIGHMADVEITAATARRLRG